MSFLPRSNLSEKLYVVAVEFPGWAFELERAAQNLDDAIAQYVLDRDALTGMVDLARAWGHAHAMYNEASGRQLQAD